MWFRFPVKFFRPSIANPWGTLHSVSNSALNKSSESFGYLRQLSKQPHLVRSVLVPLLFANACMGGVLFYTFQICNEWLKDESKGFSHKNAFLAGLAGGCAQSALSIPVDNIQKRLNFHAMSQAPNLHKAVLSAVRETLLTEKGDLRGLLYRDGSFSLH